MYPECRKCGGSLQTKNFSARSTCSIVLYPILKMVTSPVIAIFVKLFDRIILTQMLISLILPTYSLDSKKQL